MPVTVTLNIYSGRQNPSWELSDDQVKDFVGKIADASDTTFMKPPGIAGRLGYRGFSVKSIREPDLDRDIYLDSGILDLDRFDLNRVVGDSSLEKWLLTTAGSTVDKELTSIVEGELLARPDFDSTQGNSSSGPPAYNPGKWNNDASIRSRNNCYNYSNDKITNTFAQPGRGSGQVFSELTCLDVGAASERDGQVPADSASSSPAKGHFIALVIWPGRDYHWYRLDENAKWSHKPGQTRATNVDNSGNLINDPEACDRGFYTSWCGYYHCVPSQTNIQ